MIWLTIGATVLLAVFAGIFGAIARIDGWRVSLAVAGITLGVLAVILGGTLALVYGISEVAHAGTLPGSHRQVSLDTETPDLAGVV